MVTLEIENFTVTYQMQRTGRALQAVANVNLRVAKGEFLAIVGPSGCGKTTILKAAAGILTDYEGRISLNGRAINGPGRDRAMVFQSPALFPWRTVAGNVAYGLELHGWGPERQARRAQLCIDLVGLSGFEDSYPQELSGGMQQRANLARALAVQPAVLLLDEPLSALDAQTRVYMQAEMQRVWLQERTTAVYVTHSISEAIFLADRVAVLSASPGQIKAIIGVPFARPRSLKLRRSAPFQRLEEEIWNLLDPMPGRALS
jgi:NitT/TauT family transport system ATP-binding protein